MGETEMPILEVKVGDPYSDELNQGIQHRGKAKKHQFCRAIGVSNCKFGSLNTNIYFSLKLCP